MLTSYMASYTLRMLRKEKEEKRYLNTTLKDTLKTISRRLDVPYVFHDPATGNPYKEI